MFLPLSKCLILLVPILVSVAFITLLERKILSLVGNRLGPNKVSFLGVLQPIGDAVKLSNKQINFMTNASFFFYYLSAFFMILSSFLLWFCSSMGVALTSLKISLLVLMMVLGFNSLNSMIAGWSTFSKYSLIGSMRTVAQLVSYEAALYLCLFFFLLYLFNFNLNNFFFFKPTYLFLFMPFCLYIWVPSFLAELNRTPFDFSEGESELVSGFNTEFGSASFTLIFLSEYSNIIFFSLLTSLLFFSPLTFFFFFFFFFLLFGFVPSFLVSGSMN